MSDIRVVAQTGDGYPATLSRIADPPALLYVRGALPSPGEKLLAVVGTRKPTAYGREAAKFLTRELCRAGFSIVSGMALGIDGIAHETALEEGLKTYAVLGCGADVVYPAVHNKLYERILRAGGVISEFEPGTPPMPFRFLQRNRIIAGMSLGTLIVEAGERSGALVTGRLALEYNREVFAVPGSIFSQGSKGPHGLIKDGAVLVEHINDVLKEFGMEAETVQQRLQSCLEGDERKVMDALAGESLRIDELARITRLSAAALQSSLTLLEIKGLVEHLGGNIYGRKR